MSQAPKTQSKTKAAATTETARKRYAAPQLEVYGTLQDLTRAGISGSGTDSGIYSDSGPG